MAGKIKDLNNNKVDKVNGKGLSTNDFTSDYKAKVDNAAAASDIPTTLAELTDDATHRTVTDAEKSTWNSKQAALNFNSAYNASTNKAATMKDIDDAVAGVSGMDFQVVSQLPATGQKGVIYLVANGSTSGQNIYDEYIWLSSSGIYEKIGSTSVDLSDYVKKTDLEAITNSEIDAMFA